MSIDSIVVDAPLTWRDIARIAEGAAGLTLSEAAQRRIAAAHKIVDAIVAGGVRGYGVNTGVGALSDVIVPPAQQSALSRNIVMSHAVGVGAPLSPPETRAILAAAIHNFAHGRSGLRLAVVERLTVLLNAGCTPEVPRQGSVGYLSHMAHISLAVIGAGWVTLGGERMPAAAALQRLQLEPIILQAKEGLSLVNGTPCATGLACLALDQAERLADWADALAAMSFEALGGQISGLAVEAMALRHSAGLAQTAQRLRVLLAGSPRLAAVAGLRTQDALSLRGVPQVHGAVRDVLTSVADVVDRELASVTDNPVVAGTPEAPEIYSQAHAVGAAIGLALDHLAVAAAQLGIMSERRIDRLVNPLVSGLPPFLAEASGVASGLMIAQYTATALTAENRRLAAPASLDGGVNSGLQEDMLCHATPAALKLLQILANLQNILAIEALAACQAYDHLGGETKLAPQTAQLYRQFRQTAPHYADDRPLGEDIAAATAALLQARPFPLERGGR